MDQILTFEEQAARYISKLETRRKKKVKPTTIATFRSAIKMALPVLGTIPLADIESDNLKNLVDYLDREGFAPGTVRLVLRTTKSAIASAVDDRGNPLVTKAWNDDHVDAPVVTRKEITPITAAQIEAAIAAARPIVREFIATQAATGCRRGELLAMDVTDFNAADGLLHVARTRSYFGETTPKTKSGARSIDLHPDVTDMLVRMLDGRTSGRLFAVSIDEIRRAFERLGLRSHRLRHFRYTYLQMASVPNPIRDYWIGHSASGMEKVYGHMAQEALELRRKLAKDIGIGFALPSIVAPAEMAVSA